MRKNSLLAGAAVLALILLGLFFLIAPARVEQRLNPVAHSAPYQASEQARALHQKLFVADLHADSLLWARDLAERGTRGHVDLPRLSEGNVALQVFSVVMKTPRGLNTESNAGDSDNITLLALAQRWPPATWGSLRARALYQAGRARQLAERTNNPLRLIKSTADLSSYLDSWRRRQGQEHELISGLLAIEGAHALDGDLANLDALFDAGFRMMSPTHFFDNEFAGSASGVEKGGLTAAGRELIARMETKGMIVDLAHSSPQTIRDVVAMARKPLVASHTGIKGTCDSRRNLSDDEVKLIARTGGVIGIGYWETATCGDDAKAVARALRYAADLVGVRHVGLGSDFDGAVRAPFDTTGLVQITDALLAEGFSGEEVSLIMGENVLRVLRETLPH
ncbi:MAG: dipeptidase [Acidobacteria bacterium]|nr:dipeptidase [Acidobacteriota bacterium]